MSSIWILEGSSNANAFRMMDLGATELPELEGPSNAI